MDNYSKNKNFLALLIGFLGIAAIGMLTFFQPFSKPKKTIVNDALPQTDTNSSNRAIDSADLFKKIGSGEKIKLIDVRDETSFDQEHIVGAENMPISRLETDLSSLSPLGDYVFIDENESSAITYLVNNVLPNEGFVQSSYLAGGFTGWKDKNNPTISAGDPNSFIDQSKINYLNSDDLKKLMLENSHLYLIDVRKKSQFDEGHLKDAVNIFLDDLESKRDEIPLGKKIVVYDNDGLWAFQAAVRLFDLNHFNTYTLSDGLDAWKSKNYEIVK